MVRKLTKVMNNLVLTSNFKFFYISLEYFLYENFFKNSIEKNLMNNLSNLEWTHTSRIQALKQIDGRYSLEQIISKVHTKHAVSDMLSKFTQSCKIQAKKNMFDSPCCRYSTRPADQLDPPMNCDIAPPDNHSSHDHQHSNSADCCFFSSYPDRLDHSCALNFGLRDMFEAVFQMLVLFFPSSVPRGLGALVSGCLSVHRMSTTLIHSLLALMY